MHCDSSDLFKGAEIVSKLPLKANYLLLFFSYVPESFYFHLLVFA